MKKLLTLVAIFPTACTLAQEMYPKDSSLLHMLTEVEIRAYEGNTGLQQVPAAINIIDQRQLNRLGNTSILQAVNATPGVRMEERSPGSYRLSIRGSALRSPFGVRNVKIYYNDIPFSDPGGHSYFNQLGFYNIGSLEIIKGPAGSIYGAGTGGALLINSGAAYANPGATVGFTAGSFGLSNLNAEVNLRNEHTTNVIRYQRLSSDGYRAHSAMRRDVGSWDAEMKVSDKDVLSAHFLFSDLYYQTPGALTLEGYTADPRAARPANASLPGASEARAAIYSQMFLAGFTNTHRFSSRLENATTLYGAYNQLRNPTIQNYGRNTEPHFGGRSVFKYKVPAGSSQFNFVAGAELQQGYATIKTYKNRNGNPDTLLLDDEVNCRQYFAFLQATWTYKKWVATVGTSYNRQSTEFSRLNEYPFNSTRRTFDNGFAPRVALLYRLGESHSLYSNIAKGFSPPTTAELLPSGKDFNTTLSAERGWNYELGARGWLAGNRLHYDVNAFLFGLDNAIVVRRDAGGGNYFVNAGSTKQWGVESQLKYLLIRKPTRYLKEASVWTSYSYYHFRYGSFVQGNEDFSGNDLPGTPPHTFTAGLDAHTNNGLYANITYSYTDAMPLTDANDGYAAAYNLLGLRIGYKMLLRNRYMLELFAGADNLLDETYSLGNDINGFGGRYYNAASGRNFFTGISLSYLKL